MNKEIKQKWIEALRSGKYKQTRGKLKGRNGAFCCLGVLCDIQGGKWECAKNKYLLDGFYSSIPPKKLNAGIFNYAPLVDRNDGLEGGRAHSFSEIADYIEEEL